MSIVITDEIIEASQLTSKEFCQEIALYLFNSGRLTLGYASQCTFEIQTAEWIEVRSVSNL
jgi:predicted HTH domain antitoxin